MTLLVEGDSISVLEVELSVESDGKWGWWKMSSLDSLR